MKHTGLGVLALLAVTMLAPHSALAATETHFELHAFTDVNGVRTKEANISHDFPDVLSCIHFAETLPEPPASINKFGQNVTYRYTCVKITTLSMNQ